MQQTFNTKHAYQTWASFPMIWCALILLTAHILSAQNSKAGVTQPDGPLDAARQALSRGDYGQAEAQFRHLLKLHPHSSELLADLGIALHQQSRYFEAAVLFQKSLSSQQLPNTTAFLAIDYCQTQQYLKAQPLLDFLEKHEFDRSLFQAIGPCFLAANRALGAIRIYTEVSKTALTEGEQQEASAGLIRAYFDGAHQLVALLGRLPDSTEYAAAIQSAVTGAGDAKLAVEEALANQPLLENVTTLGDLIQLYSDHIQDPAIVYVLATALAERAAAGYSAFLEQWPDSLEGYRLTAETLASRGRSDDIGEAAATYERLLEKYPNAPAYIHFALGNMYESLGKHDAALAEYTKAYNPAHPDVAVLERLSGMLIEKGNTDLVRKLLLPLSGYSDAPAWLLRDYGKAEYRNGHLPEALEALKKSERADPQNAPTHYSLFLVLRDLEQKAAARAELNIFKELKYQK